MATQHSNTARWQGDLLPHVVDRLASETPDDIYGLWPVGCASYKTRFREVNYAQLANIVNGLAWWIVDQLDTSDGEQVLTYIGPNDLPDVALLVPSVVAELARNPHLLEICARYLKLILYIGGDLAAAIGDKVARKIPPRCQWGIRGGHPAAADAARVGISGLALYPLPPKSGRCLRRSHGRHAYGGADGTPRFPDPMVCGQFNLSQLLVTRTTQNDEIASTQAVFTIRGMTTADQAALIEHVWPSVEEANRAAPVHARVEKSLILVTSPDRPFIRSRKDTIQRQSSLARPDFALSTIYRNPTVEQLTAAVLERNDKADEREMMELLLITYKGLIQQIPVPKSLNPVESDAIDVLLTGSTASLETLILQALLNRPDLAHPSLALDDAIYETLRTRVGLMIHNAWLVNFNLNLSAFRPHLARLVNLCQLSAAAAPRVLQLLSISSVGAVNGEALQGEAAPETLLEPFETPGPNGYSRSKFLSKLLCDAAAKNLGIPVTFIVATRSCDQLVASQLPIEGLGHSILRGRLGEVVVDLAAANHSNSAEKETGFGTAVYNLRNPSTTTWDKLLPAIVEGASTKRQGQGCELDIVSPSVWVERLQQSMAAVTNDENSDVAAAAAANPAIKLFELYQNSLYRSNIVATRPMSVEQAVQASPTLRIMPSVCAEWTRKWVDEWLATA
ncbi:hypothetical protein CHU98_g10065 [Xylaria longipes]|nr:hypothetical protein CHU98_g10065 [Xylaria longipes]